MSTWTVPGYSQVRELGSGATGHVVEAVHDASGQHVAIKYLSSALANDEAFLERFRDEARLLVELDMPHVVRMFEYVEEPGLGAAIVMELVEGASLHDLITHRGPTIPESALAVLKGSLLGLAAAHAVGVVHRDYKPENVLVDSTGNSKLADFGIAVPAGRRVAAVGTPLYMAPEQWTGGEASPATDIYAATAVFYECLTGKPPYSGGLRQLRREHETSAIPTEAVPAPLRNLVVRGMAKDPADRPADATAFVVGLEQIALAAYGADWEERGRRHLAERSAALLLLLLGGGAVGAATGATAATFLGRRRIQIITAAAAVVVVAGTSIGIAATSSGNHASSQASTHGHKHVTALPPSAAVSVAPGTLKQACTSTPGTFTFTGSITAQQAGAVTYQWVFSNGQTSSPQTLQFSSPGTQQTVSQTLTEHASVTGWAKVEVTSPTSVTSNEAGYQLTCITKPHHGPVVVVSPPPSVPPVVVAATVSLSLKSSPPSPASFACGSPRPSFTINGAITSNQATTVTYHWLRSNGTSTGPATIFIGSGQTRHVFDSFKPPSDAFSGHDSLHITAPTSQKASIPLSLACTGSHVIMVSIVQGAPTFSDPSMGQGFITYTVTVTTEGTGPVNFNWTATPAADASGTDTGSMPLSGQTSYQFTVSPPSGFFDAAECPPPQPGQPQPFYVLSTTATGTDNVAVSQTSSFQLDCTG